MAVVNTLSEVITDLDAGKKISQYFMGGRVRFATGTAAVAAADDDGSTYRLVRLPGNAIVHQIWIYNDAITGGTDYDLGIYQTAEDGGAVQDADRFGSAISMASARTTSPIDGRHEKDNITTVAPSAFPWMNPSTSTSGSNVDYDLTFTANTVGTGAGDITVKVFYSVGD